MAAQLLSFWPPLPYHEFVPFEEYTKTLSDQQHTHLSVLLPALAEMDA